MRNLKILVGFVLLVFCEFISKANETLPQCMGEPSTCGSSGAMTILTAILALCSVISLIISGIALRHSHKIDKLTLRPIISVSIEWRENLFWLVVRNLGKTAAVNIQMKISPTPRINLGAIDEPIPFVVRPLPLLQPGAHYECAFANKDSMTTTSVEMRFKGDVHFEDMNGDKITDKIDIDARMAFESAIPCVKTTKDIVASLNAIENAIKNHDCQQEAIKS